MTCSTTTKEEMDEYFLGQMSKDYESMVNGNDSHTQTKSGSLLEAHISAFVGAPPAILANYLLLNYFYPNNPETNFVMFWAIITWPIFFYLSVSRIWIIRRVFVKWGIVLEPIALFRKIKRMIKK